MKKKSACKVLILRVSESYSLIKQEINGIKYNYILGHNNPIYVRIEEDTRNKLNKMLSSDDEVTRTMGIELLSDNMDAANLSTLDAMLGFYAPLEFIITIKEPFYE